MKIFRRARRGLARLGVAALLIAVVLVLAALGSCFPQKPVAGGRPGVLR